METALTKYEPVPYGEIEKMASAIHKSKLFGIETVEQAISLMLIAQAEGVHPAIAARDYHIIKGRPSLKADAMLARFQAAGGKVSDWVLSDERVSAVFSHPQGGSAPIDWDMKRAKAAELGGNGMWKKYPRQMLRARVISEGIRTVFPGSNQGFYTAEEVEDFEPIKTREPEKQKPEPPRPELTDGNAGIEDAQEVAMTAHEKEIAAAVAEISKAVSMDHLKDAFLAANKITPRTKADDERLVAAKDKRKTELQTPPEPKEAPAPEPPPTPVEGAVVEMFSAEAIDSTFGPAPTKKGKK